MATIQIDRLLETVVKKKASDLHLAVGKPPVLRLSGAMRELQTKVLDAEDTMALMKSITPERIQQEFEETGSGDFGFAYGDAARFRVAVFKQKGCASLVLRRIPNNIMTFEQIGLPKMAEQICRRPRGIFLVTGPTGSGKTTTLATMINWINEDRKSTRLNSSHANISYAVFCLKKKKIDKDSKTQYKISSIQKNSTNKNRTSNEDSIARPEIIQSSYYPKNT